MNRRTFFTAAALPAALATKSLYPHDLFRNPAAPGARLKLSLNAYSFNRLLMSGEMDLFDLLEFCADHNFDAIDPTGYYFPTYPEPPEDEYLFRFKRRAFELGLAISGTGVRNDFTVADAAARSSDVARIGRWVEAAAKMGAPSVRIFSGRYDDKTVPWDTIFPWLVQNVRECVAFGEKHGVIIAIQNHADYIWKVEQVARIFREIDSPWLGLNLDIGSFRTDDPYDDIARAIPYADNWQIKENMYIGGKQVKTDLKKLIGIIRAGNYRGYIPLETLGQEDPRISVPRFLAEVRAAIEAT